MTRLIPAWMIDWLEKAKVTEPERPRAPTPEPPPPRDLPDQRRGDDEEDPE